jgi:hypothetical protein
MLAGHSRRLARHSPIPKAPDYCLYLTGTPSDAAPSSHVFPHAGSRRYSTRAISAKNLEKARVHALVGAGVHGCPATFRGYPRGTPFAATCASPSRRRLICAHAWQAACVDGRAGFGASTDPRFRHPLPVGPTAARPRSPQRPKVEGGGRHPTARRRRLLARLDRLRPGV